MTKSRDTADSINRIDSSAADATAITVDSSENVGIGTTSPSSFAKLHLSSTGTTGLYVDGSQTSDANIFDMVVRNGTDSVTAISAARTGANDAAALTFSTQSTGGSLAERMRVDSGGNVDFYQGNKIRWRYAAGSTIRGSIEVDSSDNLKFFTGSSETEQMRVTSSGMQMASGKQIDTNGGRIFTQAITFSGGGTQTIDTLAASEAAIYIAQVKSYGGTDFRHGSIFYAIRTANGSPSTTTRGGYLSTQQSNSSFGISGAGVTYTAGGGNPATSIFKLRIM